MTFLTWLLLGFLIVCALSVALTKNLLASVIILMSYSLIMSVIWILLQSPDLAITEAAVGAGITSVLFFVTLKRIHAIDEDRKQELLSELLTIPDKIRKTLEDKERIQWFASKLAAQKLKTGIPHGRNAPLTGFATVQMRWTGPWYPK